MCTCLIYHLKKATLENQEELMGTTCCVGLHLRSFLQVAKENESYHFVLDAVPGQEWPYCENYIALNSNGQILHCLPYPVVVAFFFFLMNLAEM